MTRLVVVWTIVVTAGCSERAPDDDVSELCGDGAILGAETCDDGNLASGDGCNHACVAEMGWSCTEQALPCAEICGDGIVVGDELCDDGNQSPGDGCSATCLLEFCGNGELDEPEACDDGNNVAGDGCSADCLSAETCGNSVVDLSIGEQCDDGNMSGGDGCSSSCAAEAHFNCVGQPSTCTTPCGDGFISGADDCDDANSAAGDGCSAACNVEAGWQCIGAPSACNTVCGDSLVAGRELCDDGNNANGDGCDAACRPEPATPRLLALIDSSGTMNMAGCVAEFTGGDGSSECPGDDVSTSTCSVSATAGNSIPDDSRIYFTKQALQDVIVSGIGGVEWALMRFEQTAVSPFACPVQDPLMQSGGWQGAGEACQSGVGDAGEMLVSWSAGADNTDELFSWIDSARASTTVDDELRATGTRPLAGSLSSALDHIQAVRATDADGTCRPYAVVLVTDGVDTCGGNPPAAAQQLFQEGIPVHVLSLVGDTSSIEAHRAIAQAGGTTDAFFVDEGSELLTLLFGIAGAQTIPEACNGIDDDCDGFIDDDFPELGEPCDNGQLGACERNGTTMCRSDGKDVVCSAVSVMPTPETCNGIDDDCDGVIDDVVPACGTCTSPMAFESCNARDDDCDGKVDEASPGAMVQIVGGSTNFWIDTYEASRPDATATTIGTVSWQACSEPDRLPWFGATYVEATAACAAQGKRLCTEAEWQLACSGPTGNAYPYGSQFDTDACNGREYDHDCTGLDESATLATGTAYGCPKPATSSCVSTYGAVDMSGNVAEWTSTPVGAAAFRVRGGSYNSRLEGLSCDFASVSLPPDTGYGDVGFRCCSDTFPAP